MNSKKVLCLQVTSDNGNTVIPEFVCRYLCAKCGAGGQLLKVCGFGLPDKNRCSLFLLTSETVQTECQDCGHVINVHTEIVETEEVEIVEDRGGK
jgi:hypothetical protein